MNMPNFYGTGIQPCGSQPFENSFITRMAQQIMQTPQEELIASPNQTPEFSFDGFLIAGYQNAVGDDKRFIKPQDKMKAFQIVLRD